VTRVQITGDTISPAGARITTFLLEYPLVIHAEVLRHKALSHQVASSRAIPTSEYIKKAAWIPSKFHARRPGMSGDPAGLSPVRDLLARGVWRFLQGMERVGARVLSWLGVAKEHANRRLACDAYVVHLVTATEDGWENFFKLRCAEGVQPEIRKLAYMMRSHMGYNTPIMGGTHYPLRLLGAFGVDESVGKLARISYGGVPVDEPKEASLDRRNRLWASKHVSPFEHVAFSLDDPKAVCKNLTGWRSYRTILEEGI